jgi:uncharacterized protein (TIGR03790 family)
MKLLVSVLAILAIPVAVRAQTPANVLLVVNDDEPASVEIGEYYAKARGLPASQIVRVKAPVQDAVSRPEFERTIEQPIGQWLNRHQLQDRILYIVLTKGVPLKILGTPGREGSTASVDSELTLLYRKMVGTPATTAGRVANPYFLGEQPITAAAPFSRAAFDIYLVTRLDGFTVADVKALIDRAAAATTTGRVVLDQRATEPDRTGDSWLARAAEEIAKIDQTRALLEGTRARAAAAEPAIGYFSWGSNDTANRQRTVGLQFSPGAIGGMFLSTDARTFREPPAAWRPVDGPVNDAMFGPGSQSLAGDLVRDGITGLAASVSEPFLDGMVRPQILFPAYLAGRTLADAFYLATPFLSWQGVVIGDPLCSPFATPVATAVESPDPATGLPRHFAERRLKALARTGTSPAALTVMLKAEAMLAADPNADLEPILLNALNLEPNDQNIGLQLSTFYEGRKEYDKAIALYRKLLASAPNNAVIMNNLAYALASHKKELVEAKELAEKALLLQRNPLIADTLGWIYHLSGDTRRALPLLEYAAAGASNDAEVLLHLATVYAELDDKARARNVLNVLLKVSPEAAERAEVKALQARVKG